MTEAKENSEIEVISIEEGISSTEFVEAFNDLSLSQNLVSKSNSLVRASYKLSLQEQRLILAGISKLDSRRLGFFSAKNNQATVHISAQEFGETFGISPKKAYEELKEATDNIFERKITEIEGKTTTKLRWVSKVKYHDGEGWAEMTFSQDILPYLTLLREKFTSYKLKQVAGLRSVYSIRLFEKCMQFSSTGMMRTTLEDFIKELELPYTRFTDIKRRVIDPAVIELRAKSNMEIEWKPITVRRRVVSLEFRFTESAQAKLDI